MDFDGIYREYFTDVYLYLRSLSADQTAAEELTQETFFKALRAIDRFDGRKDMRAWLFTIAKNAWISRCRRKTPREELPEDVPDPATGVEEKIMNEDTAMTIHRFLHSMAEPCKEVFTLRVFGELPFERIAAIFGKSPGWARVTFYRAKKQIMEYMEGLDNE